MLLPLVMPPSRRRWRSSRARSSGSALRRGAGRRRPARSGRPGKPKRQRASLGERGRRLAFGVVAGLLALLLTRWIVAGVGIGLLVAFWDKIAGSSKVEKLGISRLEALAAWTESLRDTIAGAIGLEQAIPATAVNAGAADPARR